MAEAVAPVSFTASLTVANTGRSKCVEPAFFGLVPPTILVPCDYKHFYHKNQIISHLGTGLITVRDSLLGMESGQHRVFISSTQQVMAIYLYSRSLFTGEALEDDTCLAVYAKIANCR